MPYCPECRAEYVPGVKTCAECDVPLVDFLPPEFIDTEDWQIVYTTMQEYEAEMIRSRLEEDGILARVLSKADHAMGLKIGDLAVVHLLVHNDDVEDAKRIINEDESIDPDTLDDLAGEDTTDL